MKIGTKLVLAFLVLSLLAVTVVSIVSYSGADRALGEEALNKLESVAHIQKQRVEFIVEQNLERLVLVSSRTQLRITLENFTRDPRVEYQDFMNQILGDSKSSISSFRDVSVLTLDGKVVASTDTAMMGTNHSNEEFFVRGQNENIADIFFLDENHSLGLRLSGPLYLDDELLGVLMIESDVDNILSMVQDYTGLGSTGETLLARRDANGDALFLMPLRFDQQAALNRTLSKDDLSAPITQALLGNEGLLVNAVDYRGEPVLAATRYVEETDWGLVIKIDRAEAFASVYSLRNSLLLIILVSSIVVILISIHIARTISRPIVELTRVAGQIGKGNLSQGAQTASTDEIGVLAETLNGMARRLQQSYRALREEVSERKQAEEEARREALNLQYLYRAALEFTAFPQEDDIYEHIGKRLNEITGNSIILVSSYDENAGLHEVRSVVGLGKLSRAITKMMGSNIVGMQFNALPGLDEELKSGRLVKLSHGIHELTEGRISKRTSEALIKMAKIGDIHSIGIGREETVFAQVTIMTRRGTKLENRTLIETFASQASMALQRRRASEELERSKEMLIEAQRVAHVGNWTWNIQTDELIWSEEIYRIFGLNHREFGATYEAFLNSVHPDDIDLVQRSIGGALKKRKPYGVDHRIVLPSGEVRFVHEEGEVIANEKGEPIGMIGTVQDITDRKEVEEQIKSSEERFRLVFQHAPDGYILKDLDGTTVDVNRSFVEMLGFEKNEWLGKRFGEMGILPEGEADRFAEDFGAVVEGRESGPEEFSFIRKDGSPVQAEIRGVPITLGGQKMVLGIVRDITEAKKAEQRLIRSEKLAGIGTLVSGIAHEVNNPLAGVTGYAEAILDEDDPALIKDHARKIVDAAGRASEVVRWLSRYSREGMDLNMVDMDLNDLVQESLEAIRITRKPQNIDIVANLGDIPPVEGSRHALQQVFINLLQNSVDALENGGQIVLSTRDKGDLVEVEISDTGTGIPEEHTLQIFDPFFTTKGVGKGTGLGLYVMSMIVKRHRGSIDVAGSEGKGTTITLTLPAKNEESKDGGQA